MRRRRINNRSGETIVEVMVSVLIFLMLMAVLQGAIMFCNSAQKKSQQIRQDTAEICEKLQSATAEGNGSANFDFYATSADESVIGDNVFSISAPKQKKTVSYGAAGETSSTIFYMYGGTAP